MAKKDLVRLLARLYGDPVDEARFQKNRAKYLEGSRLSKQERELLETGDVDGIRAHLGSDADKVMIIDTALIHIVDSAVTRKRAPTVREKAGKATAKKTKRTTTKKKPKS